MENLAARAADNLEKLRAGKPLIHNITNFVVMNFTANVLLAAGASPVMAHAANEVEEMAGYAGGLVLNIGTLTDDWVESMLLAGKTCSKLGTAIVLDPVGSGATRLRTAAAKRLIAETSVSIIRGNASEVLSLRSDNSKTKGVDALHTVEEAAATAAELAGELATTLAITGPVDLITDGKRQVRVANGHEMMPLVTGTGCAASALIGAFAAVDGDPLLAAATALAYFGLAGEKAAEKAQGPGSFQSALLDALYLLTPDEVAAGCRIVVA